jgi:multisubunit Na+/H+ antiporter MnhE subunit
MIFPVLLGLVFALLLSSSYDGPTVFLINLAIGTGAAYILLQWIPQRPTSRRAQPALPRWAHVSQFTRNLVPFTWDFLKDLTLSNIAVAKDVWRPTGKYSPVLVQVPVEDLSDFEAVVLANRITLTPGTLSAEITADRRFIIVHAMYDGGPTQPADLRRPIDMLRKGL